MTTHAQIHLSQSWQIELGPYLVVEQLRQELKLSANQVEALVTQRRLLEVRDAERTTIYPALALVQAGPSNSDLRMLPNLKPVLDALAISCDEVWLWLMWLSGLDPKHRGRAPIDALRSGDDRILEAARNEDWSWTARFF